MAEAVIFRIKNFEEVKNIIIDLVKGMRPIAVEEAEVTPSKDTNQQIFKELRRIRKTLEK